MEQLPRRLSQCMAIVGEKSLFTGKSWAVRQNHKGAIVKYTPVLGRALKILKSKKVEFFNLENLGTEVRSNSVRVGEIKISKGELN